MENEKKTDFSEMPRNEILAIALSSMLMGLVTVGFTTGLSDIGQKMIFFFVLMSAYITQCVFIQLKRNSTARIVEAIENLKRT